MKIVPGHVLIDVPFYTLAPGALPPDTRAIGPGRQNAEIPSLKGDAR